MDVITFVTTAEIRTVSRRIPREEAAFWWIVILPPSSQFRGGCATAQLSRHLRRRCKRFLALLDGRSETLGEVCGAGKSIVISAKTNRLGQANYKAGRGGGRFFVVTSARSAQQQYTR